MIKEYRTSTLALPSPNDEKWEAVITVDLRYIIAAEPWEGEEDPRFTMLTISGGRRVPIREEYSQFIRDWHSVKR